MAHPFIIGRTEVETGVGVSTGFAICRRAAVKDKQLPVVTKLQLSLFKIALICP
jgi:hypothetical protein